MILNFPNSLRVAKICSKYFSVEEIGAMKPSEFVPLLVEKVEDEEMDFFVGLVETSGAEEFLDKLTVLLLENSILDLISYYQKIGGTNGI